MNSVIYLGGGCFWCTEAIFKKIKGVVNVIPGYTGGTVNNPNYNDTGNGLNFSVASITNDEPDSGYENSIISTSVGLRVEQFERIYFK